MSMSDNVLATNDSECSIIMQRFCSVLDGKNDPSQFHGDQFAVTQLLHGCNGRPNEGPFVIVLE